MASTLISQFDLVCENKVRAGSLQHDDDGGLPRWLSGRQCPVRLDRSEEALLLLFDDNGAGWDHFRLPTIPCGSVGLSFPVWPRSYGSHGLLLCASHGAGGQDEACPCRSPVPDRVVVWSFPDGCPQLLSPGLAADSAHCFGAHSRLPPVLVDCSRVPSMVGRQRTGGARDGHPEKAAKVNGVILPDDLTCTAHDRKHDDSSRVSSFAPLRLIEYPTMVVRGVIIAFNWAVISMVYYGLSLNVSNLTGGLRLNFLLSCVVELVGYISCSGSQRLLAMIGKLGVSSSFAIIYLYSAELYPTVMRNFGVGCGSMFARVGSLLSPYIVDLRRSSWLVDYSKDKINHRALPLIVFGSLAVAAGLVSLLLPETLRQKLPETLSDAAIFGKWSGHVVYNNTKTVDANGEFLLSRTDSRREKEAMIAEDSELNIQIKRDDLLETT
ncbi:hypothetical protein C0Q70_10923 [Pomacea canaliculata]|uniref:Major facilitator superfamily (MFS) profile domain-containing protein n=1 Tax=Pomacea canaliculata TaxID=400727 RepID=A0A2T7P4K5_POMCA|nr:hypothetical protein C0Q70_10923 [Pomacea canaliculata]